MQVKATAKFKKQQRIDADVIGQEVQAASRAKTQDSLQDLFKRWNSSMEQASCLFSDTPQAVCRACIQSFHPVTTGAQQCLSTCRLEVMYLSLAGGASRAFER